MRRVIVSSFAAVALMAALVGTNLNGATGSSTPPRSSAIWHQPSAAVRAALSRPTKLPNGNPIPSLSGGVMSTYTELAAHSRAARVASAPPLTPTGTSGCPFVYAGAPENIRANQDCSLRRQAEEQVAVNPLDPTNIVVGQNESQHGFNQTGTDWSIDGGQHFGYAPIPTRYLDCNGIGQDAWSDPAMAFDQTGSEYYTAVGFDLNTPVSTIAVWKSPAGAEGSFLANAGNTLSSNPTVVFDNCSNPFLSPDKEFIAADSHASSPYEGNVYVTFTIFDFTCGGGGSFCASPIFFSKSTDGGNTFSPAVEISGNSPACKLGNAFDPSRNKHDCDFDQGSWPVIGADGSINVVYNNCNTTETAASGLPAACQQLFTKSTDGGSTWSTPVSVARDFARQPINLGNAAMNSVGCNFGRQCLYPNGYRQDDFPSMGMSDSGELAVFWSDFKNGGPCDTSGGFITEPCANHNNDVWAAYSTDGGATWTGRKLVTPDPSAQWQPWGALAPDGTRYVAYYDRSYGTCETDGCNDITLASKAPDTPGWTYQRITTGSMPNLTPSNNPVQAGFLGDYMFITVAGGQVHIVWGDTRGVGGSTNPVPEEDVFYATVPAA